MPIQTLGLSPPERRSTPLDNPAVSLSSPDGWVWLSGGRESDAGELINDQTALKISTVYCCIRVLAESVASLPVRLLKITPQGKLQELDNPLAFLLGVAPNPEMTSFVFFETLTTHLMLTGNAYAEIQRSMDGKPVALWPLNPRLTRAVRMPNGDLAFETSDGELGTGRRTLAARDVLHVPLMSLDGIVGMSPITQAARSMGVAAAAAKFGARLFANNAMPSGILTTTGKIKPEVKIQMRNDWEAMQLGSNQHRIAVLDQELKYERLSITPDEAQFLETRIHERSEICAIFRVPMHMAGSEQKLSNSNVEQLNLSFIVDTLRPILSRIEAEFVRKLMPGEPGTPTLLTVQFDLSERQRGDTAAQVSLIAAGRQWGVLSANDGLRILGLPVAGAAEDVRMVPVNMVNAERLLDAPKPATSVVVNE